MLTPGALARARVGLCQERPRHLLSPRRSRRIRFKCGPFGIRFRVPAEGPDQPHRSLPTSRRPVCRRQRKPRSSLTLFRDGCWPTDHRTSHDRRGPIIREYRRRPRPSHDQQSNFAIIDESPCPRWRGKLMLTVPPISGSRCRSPQFDPGPLRSNSPSCLSPSSR
jgi:hypothetical protein